MSFQPLDQAHRPTGPKRLHKRKRGIKVGRQRTAVTLGCSIQGSTMSGPTLCTITIVLLFCAATALTRLSPPCHAVRFFLRNPHDQRSTSARRKNHDSYLSPSLPSTVMYCSPESELMKTRAADFFRATLPARARLKSSKNHDTLVRSSRARRWIASSGCTIRGQ